MSFFKDFASSLKSSVNKVTTLIERELSTFVDDNVVFGKDELTFIAFVRPDAPKNRLLFEVQQYLRGKMWRIKHVSKASLIATCLHPHLRTIVVKLGATAQKQRVLHFTYQSAVEETTQAFFRGLMMSSATRLGQNKLLKTQEKEEMVPLKDGEISLNDDPEMPEAPVAAVTESGEIQKEESISTVVARAILFREEGECTDEDNAVCVCHLNKEVTLSIIRQLADQVADGLNCEETSLVREQGGVVYVVKDGEGVEYEFGLTIGYTDDNQRLLLGQYPKEGEFGRDFWRRLAITLAQNRCLFGQILPAHLRVLSPAGSAVSSPITSPNKMPTSPLQQRNFMAEINAVAMDNENEENCVTPSKKYNNNSMDVDRPALGQVSVPPKSPDCMDVDL